MHGNVRAGRDESGDGDCGRFPGLGPMVAISGQVYKTLIGRGAFQEADVFGMTLPVVKHSYLVTDINDIPRIVNEAFHIAQTGRPGPVLIDIPKDVQEGRASRFFRGKSICGATRRSGISTKPL